MRIASRVQVAVLVSCVVGGLGSSAAFAWDPGLNQPGRLGNRPIPHGAWDPRINEPGATGNRQAPRGAWDPGISQPGRARNVRRFYR